MRLVSWRLYLFAVVSALLQLLPFPLAGPVPLWRRLIFWLSLVPLLYALRSKDTSGKDLGPRQAALLAYVCGVVWFCGNCYWIYQTMFLYGGLPAPASLGILILFSLYLGLYFALFGACFALVQRYKGAGTALALSPFLWVAVELARTQITGFPWDLLGYTQLENTLLTPIAPWTGVMGLSLVVAAGNMLWLCGSSARISPLHWRRWLGPASALLLGILSYIGSTRTLPAQTATSAAILVQDNLSVGAQAIGPHENQSEL